VVNSAQALYALSPLDGRYAHQLEDLAKLCSEAALIRYRMRIEAQWLLFLATDLKVAELASLPGSVIERLRALTTHPLSDEAHTVKAHEKTTNHDVKAVEYALRDALSAAGATPAQLEFVHFACTSEDINNLAYALMLKDARDELFTPQLNAITQWLTEGASVYAEQAMMSRTHGQPATPTTLGKELANVAYRLAHAHANWQQVKPLGKINGAVGNFNAHVIAYPDIDWPTAAARFVSQLGLTYNPYTIQIEPHDWLAEYADASTRINTILIDFARDVWGYIAWGYFRQRVVAGEVGSSTMPHKVNPIDFENAEGNCGIANALWRHFSEKLPISRFQRDLTDSTVLRNVGVALGHGLLALKSLQRGCQRIEVYPEAMHADLNDNWELLAEPIQTLMRRYGIPNAYEQLKALTRGQRLSAQHLNDFIDGLAIPTAERARLKALTPATYTGLAAQLARDCKSKLP
jgi:adenylosuccinate lyase